MSKSDMEAQKNDREPFALTGWSCKHGRRLHYDIWGAFMELDIAIITLVALTGGYIAGMLVQGYVPSHHLAPETKDVVKGGVGAIVTLAGLVLGLLVASTKGSFDTKADEVHAFSASLIEMDRALSHYGPEATAVRTALKRYTTLKLADTWPDESGMSDDAAAALDDSKGVAALETIGVELRGLKPNNPTQSSIQSRAMDLYYRITDARWAMAAQRGTTVQPVFLVILIFWLTVMFTSFGLFAPNNPTAMFFMVLCAISFAAAIYIVLEMDGPFSGLITISSQPMRDALAAMGH